MSATQPLTILDGVYDVLSRSPDPLSADQIAAVARVEGYDLTGRAVRKEIDAHLYEYGHRSPFTEIGRACYGLISPPSQLENSLGSLSISKPVAATAALLVILFLAFLVIKLEPSSIEDESTSSPAPPPAEPARPGVIPGDPNWWPAHAQNQINREAMDVAQQFLRNPYNTCGPAVVAMMASYYHEHSGYGGERVTTAEVLRDAREKLGYYTPPYNSGLLEFSNLKDLLDLYGLAQASEEGRSSFMPLAELLEGLRQGNPAIAGMRYAYQSDLRYRPAGGRGLYNHFVIVYQIDQANGQERLWVLNPHPGKYLTRDRDVAPDSMSVEQFKRSWAINDGSEEGDYGYAAFYRSDL